MKHLFLEPIKAENDIPPFDDEHIPYTDGMLASIKYDGHRMMLLCGEAMVSPKLKEIPNRQLWSHFADVVQTCKTYRLILDGELWSPIRTFQELSSFFRSHDKPLPPDIGYYIFDMMTEDAWVNGGEAKYISRYTTMLNVAGQMGWRNVKLVGQKSVFTPDAAEAEFNHQLDKGHEGIILRSPNGYYKHGRCTLREGNMYKFKEFITVDGTIEEPIIQNKLSEGVERTRDEFTGLLERIHRQEAYEPDNKIAGFKVRLVEDPNTIVGVKAGKGFTNTDKMDWFNLFSGNSEHFRGKHVEFKYMPHGTKDKPRIGSLVRFRPDLD